MDHSMYSDQKLVEREATIDGKKYLVQVPEWETDYTRGLIIGPPDLSSLDLPQDVETRLHNELYARGLIRKKDILRKRQEVFSAFQFALSVDTERIMECYNA